VEQSNSDKPVQYPIMKNQSRELVMTPERKDQSHKAPQPTKACQKPIVMKTGKMPITNHPPNKAA